MTVDHQPVGAGPSVPAGAGDAAGDGAVPSSCSPGIAEVGELSGVFRVFAVFGVVTAPFCEIVTTPWLLVQVVVGIWPASTWLARALISVVI